VTLDPIHVENIAQLAYGIAGDVDTTDHDDLAGRVWREWLPELRHDGRVVIEPVDEHERRRAPIDDAALTDRPFETVHGLDSGTINPTTFKNGPSSTWPTPRWRARRQTWTSTATERSSRRFTPATRPRISTASGPRATTATPASACSTRRG